MMSKEAFEQFLNILLVHQHSSHQSYSRNRIDGYIYMYLLFQAQNQGMQLSSNILKNWRKLELPENLREVFERFIEEPPELSENIIKICSPEFIISVFKYTYTHYLANYPATSTPRYLYSLISFLLEPAQEETIADFYGNPSFLKYLSRSKLPIILRLIAK